MNLSKTAQLLIACSIFLFVFLIFSSVDLALTIGVSAYIFFAKVNFPKVFIVSGVLFILGIIFKYYNINIRFISDLTFDAYIFFVLGVGLYVGTRKDFLEVLERFRRDNTNLFSRKMFLSFAGSLMLALLTVPIVGKYFAAILGYFLFSFLLKKFNGKIAVFISLCLLFLAAVLLLLGKSAIAEELGNFTFFFLVIGTAQEVINLVRQKKIDDIKLPEKQPVQLHERINVTYSGFNIPKINPRIVFAVLILSTVSLLLYFSYTLISQNKFPLSIPQLNLKSPTPSLVPTLAIVPSLSPSITPVPILKVSTSEAKLKILVLNGTEIMGLAGSTSAKLKNIGFLNIETGNARKTDYKNWEVTFKKDDKELLELLKQSLVLENLVVNEASPSAVQDILIIAGTEK